jgi:hypothetical protein
LVASPRPEEVMMKPHSMPTENNFSEIGPAIVRWTPAPNNPPPEIKAALSKIDSAIVPWTPAESTPSPEINAALSQINAGTVRLTLPERDNGKGSTTVSSGEDSHSASDTAVGDTGWDRSPEAFNSVDVYSAADPHALSIFHAEMSPILELEQPRVPEATVGVDELIPLESQPVVIAASPSVPEPSNAPLPEPELPSTSQSATQHAPPPAIASFESGSPLFSKLASAAAFCVICFVTIAVAEVVRGRSARSPVSVPQQGQLTVESRPIGAELIVDGETRGSTPLTISLQPGAHLVTLRSSSVERSIPVEMTTGADVRQYFDLGSTDTHATRLGKISVVSNPPKLQISVDGQRRGASPLLIADVAPGQHRVSLTDVSLSGVAQALEQTVVVEDGATASLVFTVPKARSTELAGWLKVSVPFECQILEDDEILGTTGSAKTMLTSGRHEITLSNQAIGFRQSQTIEVTPGKLTAVVVTPPRAELSANARPWADVSIDGEPFGETPLGHVAVPIGPHEILFQHPQLGERRQTIVVTAKGPNRVAVDFSK